MSAYKNIAGEEACIGDIFHGTTSLILCGTYRDPEEIYSKLSKCGISRRIEVNLISEEGTYDGNMERYANARYGIRLCDVPVKDAFNLPDWEE